MKKLLFIINPHAGKKQIQSRLFDLAELFEQNGFFVSLRITQHGGHAGEIIQEYGEGFDAVVICGGDGTVDEGINGLMSIPEPPVLGIIPGGTINDLASSFGISRNIMSAGREFVSGVRMKYDIGRFQNERYFSYVAAFGMFTQVAYETTQSDKNAWGRLAYLINGLSAMGNVEPCQTKVSYQGGSFEDEYIFGAVCNTVSIGGFAQFQRQGVSLEDGLFEGLFIKKPENVLGYQQVFSNFWAQDYDPKVIQLVQSPWFEIQTDPPTRWILDGEDGGKHNRVQIQTIPKAISVVRRPLLSEMED